jgi:hypothetical protein
MPLGAAMLQLAPMLGGEIGVAAAVGLEGGLEILKAVDEAQDRGLVGRETGGPDANGRGP